MGVIYDRLKLGSTAASDCQTGQNKGRYHKKEVSWGACIRVRYTQYPIIRNGLIRNSAEFLGKFKKRALGRSNLRNASKNLRNGQCSDFQS